jgi:hypothetical protein
MRLQTKSPDPEAVPMPRRTASRATTDPQGRGPAGPPRSARRSVRRYVVSSARSLRRSAPEPRSGRWDRETPPIPLTLRGMQGAPHRQARSSARSFFLLPSVLALLALVLFPVSAFAESSSGATYEIEVPSIESEPSTSSHEKAPTHHKTPNNPPAEGSAAKETGGVGSSESGEGSGSEGHKKEGSSSEEEEGNPSTAGGGGGGSKPNGGAGGGGPEGSIGESKDLGGTQNGQNVAAESSSGGGSSPVVPILIAVVVLAAISIGVVLYRQRKSDQDGPDGRVSSSNAS